MKKCLAALLAVLTALFPALGAAGAEEKTLRVVTTIFPLYDWTREVLGDAPGAELTLLLDSGVDPHSYQPSVADIMKVAGCDVFIYVGGESDGWVRDALKEAVNRDMIAVNLLDALGGDARTEEIVEGMEPEETSGEAPEQAETADEHIWLSLRNARKLTGSIAEALAQANPARAEAFRENAAAFREKLDVLDQAYGKAVASALLKTVLFGDRFPFRYLTEDYGLTYYAAFPGCSAETEASFRTIAFLAQKVDELGLPAVLTIDGSDRRVAETIVQATTAKNQAVLTLDSLQSTTRADIEAGKTYLSAMEANLAVLRQAIN